MKLLSSAYIAAVKSRSQRLGSVPIAFWMFAFPWRLLFTSDCQKAGSDPFTRSDA